MRIEMENLKNTMKLSEIKHVIQGMNKTFIISRLYQRKKDQ